MCLVNENRNNNEKQKLEKEIEEWSTDSMSHIQASVAFVDKKQRLFYRISIGTMLHIANRNLHCKHFSRNYLK